MAELGEITIDRKAAYRHLYGRVSQDTDFSQTRFGRWLVNLQREDYITLHHNDSGSKSIEITNKGRLKIIDSIANSIPASKKKYFVSFDIPEDLRSARDAFRRAIKGMGFVQVQKSLWATNKNITDLVEMAAYYYRIEKFVVTILADQSNIDGVIERELV